MKQVYVSYETQDPGTAGWYKFCPFCRTELAVRTHGRLPRPTCQACGFVQFQNPAPVVSILILHNGKVLLGKRQASPGAGKWALPSGYVEYGDNFLTTAIQEAREETGLEVEIQGILNVVSSFFAPGFHFLTIYVMVTVLGGTLAAGDDLAEVQWFPMSGPWPDLAFEEDVDMLASYAQDSQACLPVDAACAHAVRVHDKE